MDDSAYLYKPVGNCSALLSRAIHAEMNRLLGYLAPYTRDTDFVHRIMVGTSQESP